jgi:LDH2 family malate/lactate/ureidoglycolate dehydrogenase
MAKKGFIGIVLCNSPAQMTAPNGKSKLLGTNPLAIAVPNGEKPIVLDMATSAVAKSKIKQMKEKGECIPLGWALDENYQPTQDAEAALKGYVLPMAGFKGYGLARKRHGNTA